MKPYIVIIEDDITDIDKIKNLLSSRYDFYPENQSTDNSFINNVRDSINNKNPRKNDAEKAVKDALSTFSDNITAFIVDYQLENVDERTVTISGLKFYQDFISKEYPTKPCMILTHLKSANEINSILDEIDKINDRNKLTLRLKQLTDSNFQNSVKHFVDKANPILRLIEKIKQKSIRNRNNQLDQTLDDIKNNYTLYNNSVISILTTFAKSTHEIDDNKQSGFINQCSNCKI
ncbi:MAG: hypothetical protein LBO74_02945 [Candidatus Symbiothrix sp.]|jgi:hypothetical protein|nr:hypothetical protein [Candidatus Symbiothrix sp.]